MFANFAVSAQNYPFLLEIMLKIPDIKNIASKI